MTDNSTMGGTDVIRDKDRSGVKTQVVGLDLGIGGSESLMNGVMPVSDNGGNLSIDDGGNSITVDAPVGTPAFTRLSDGTAALTTTGGRLSVDASGVAVPITDNSGSLTVDAPVGTPVFVRLSDGSSAIATLPVSLASLPALAAGSAAIGKLAANDGVDIGDVTINGLPSIARQVTATPTISTSPAYTSGDALGGLLTFTNAIGTSGGKGIIDTITILDLDKLDSAIDIVFFDQTFTASSDNAVFDPSDGDAANVLGAVSISPGNYFDFNDWSVATKTNVGFAFKLSGSTSLFAQMVIRTASTYAATTALTVKLTIREV